MTIKNQASTNRKDWLQVDDLHQIYFEDWGPLEESPILFVHGGPGAGFSKRDYQFFDFSQDRVIFVDQRGSGKSQPSGALENNTTWDLISDFEKLRIHLGIKKWSLFGGSWGTTLSLAYAIEHPDVIQAILLRGVFLCSQEELDWSRKSGARRIYPEAFEQFLKPLQGIEIQGSPISEYHQKIISADTETSESAILAWNQWDHRLSYFDTDKRNQIPQVIEQKHRTMARLESFYFSRLGFLKKDYFSLKNLSRLKDIPISIIQGEFDLICPPVSAWWLHQTLSNCRINIVPHAGHSAFEEKLLSALTHEVEVFLRKERESR